MRGGLEGRPIKSVQIKRPSDRVRETYAGTNNGAMLPDVLIGALNSIYCGGAHPVRRVRGTRRWEMVTEMLRVSVLVPSDTGNTALMRVYSSGRNRPIMVASFIMEG